MLEREIIQRHLKCAWLIAGRLRIPVAHFSYHTGS